MRSRLLVRGLTVVLGAGLLVAAGEGAYAAPATPKLSITAATAAQTAKTRVKTTVKVTLVRGKTSSKVTAKVALNPTGSTSATGATQTKTVTLRWSKGAYRAATSFSAAATGKVAVSSKGAKSISKTVAKPSGAFVGWRTASQVVNDSPYAEPQRDIELRGAWGRKVWMQTQRGSAWANVRSYTTYNGSSDFALLELPASWSMTRTSKWRLYAPATTQAAAVTSGTWTLTVANQRTLGQSASLSTESWTLSTVSTVSSYTDIIGEVVTAQPGEQIVKLTGVYTLGGTESEPFSCWAGTAGLDVRDAAGRSMVLDDLQIDPVGDPNCDKALFPGQSRPFVAYFRGLAGSPVARVSFEDRQSEQGTTFVYFLR